MIKRPKTVEAYVELVNQALFETEDLRMAMEYDAESMGNLPYLEILEPILKDLRESMRDGSYQFENEDLSFMDIVEKESDKTMPFKFLLRMINETHRKGLDISDDD